VVVVPRDGSPARSARGKGAKVQWAAGTSVSAMALLQRFTTVDNRSPGYLARLVIAHNPFAAIPLPLDFAGPHDEQLGPITHDDQPHRGQWGHVASGRLVPQVGAVY
jgi:hypothetical protein